MPERDILALSEESTDFHILATAARAAGLLELFAATGPFTLFAPSNTAFTRIDRPTLNKLLGDKLALRALLLHHVIPGRVHSADVARLHKDPTFRTPSGELTVRYREGTLSVGNAAVVRADLEATNGVVHVINQVLFPNVAEKEDAHWVGEK